MESYKVLIWGKSYEFLWIVETELLTTQIEDKKFVLWTTYDFFTTYGLNNHPDLPDCFSDDKIMVFYKEKWHIASWSYRRNDADNGFQLHLYWQVLNPIN